MKMYLGTAFFPSSLKHFKEEKVELHNINFTLISSTSFCHKNRIPCCQLYRKVTVIIFPIPFRVANGNPNIVT